MLSVVSFMFMFISVVHAGEPEADARATVEFPDGTWSYVDDDSVRVGALEWKGALLWEFVGMARFDRDPTPWPESVYFDGDEHAPASHAARVLGSIRTDGNGRQWIAVDGDFTEADWIEDFDVPMEEAGEWYPNTWTNGSCSPDTVRLFDGESRGVFSTLSAVRHHRIISVTTALGSCTGVQVGPSDVLTNAHCVTQSSDLDTPVAIVALCSRGNFYTSADCVSDRPFVVTISPAWAGGSDNPSNDFALIEWTNSSSTDATMLTGAASTGMPISDMTDTEIEDAKVGMYGFPANQFPGSCATQFESANVDTQTNNAWNMSFEWRFDQTVPTERIHTNVDCSDGQSGSAYLACPGDPDNCTTGEELVGLHSSFVTTITLNKYCGGPKAAQFHDFVDDNL